MFALMGLQVIKSLEAEATDGANVGSFPRVGPLVNLQDVCPSEAFVTHGAAVRFLLRMNPPVQFQVPQPAELLATHGAAVGFARLAALVSLLLAVRGELFTALAAEMEAWLRVKFLVDLQVRGLSKGLSTLRTFVRGPLVGAFVSVLLNLW